MNASISVNQPFSKVPDCGLRVAGLTPYSSIDYPGCLSAVVWVQGCPWRCTYCHNPHLQSRTAPPQMHWDAVMAFLRKRAGLLDAVVFSGGEATTDRHLAAAMAEARALGYKVGLHTAGCYPDRLQQVLPLLDWVGLDIKTLDHNYSVLTGVDGSECAVWQSLQLMQESDISYQIRTTVHSRWLPAEQLCELLQRLADSGVADFKLQFFRRDGCQNTELQPESPRQYMSSSAVRKILKLFPLCLVDECL